MPIPDKAISLEQQINEWRRYLRRRQAIHTVDVAELEDHLRQQVADLVDAGLATDEAFLIAVKRMGGLDALSREFAQEHSGRLWKQLAVVPADSGALHLPIELWLMVGIAYAGGRWGGVGWTYGLRAVLGRTVHLLRADCPRRRGSHRVHGNISGYAGIFSRLERMSASLHRLSPYTQTLPALPR